MPGANDQGAPALLLFTSGSTGVPKGVFHGAKGLLAKIDDLSAAHELTDEDVVIAPYSLSHIGGMIYNLLMPLGIGTRAILLAHWDPGRALDMVVRHSVTFVSAVPTHFHQMIAHRHFSPRIVEPIRLAALGGTRVLPEDVEIVERSFDAVAKRSYGSSEVPTITTSGNRDPLAKRAYTDGAPIGAAQVLIIDGHGERVKPSVEGELCVKGPSLLLGYLGATDDDGLFTEDGWFRTGDLGRVDLDGYLTITGRAKDIIIRGGENLAPAEIERCLIKHPAVSEVAVVGMPDRLLGERACAFVATQDAHFDFDTMITWLREHGVAPRRLPERLEIRQALPTTSTGKVKKDLLREEIARLCRDSAEGTTSGP
jgi:cyclohexanecarboxylate-CoA ligase